MDSNTNYKTYCLGNLWSGRLSYVRDEVIFCWEDLTDNEKELIESGEVGARTVFRKLMPLREAGSILEENLGYEGSLRSTAS